MSVKETILWLAGLLEGEGCFTRLIAKPGEPLLFFGSNDRDVAERVARLFGTTVVVRPPAPKRPSIFYQVRARGSTAAGWMMSVYPFMGQRRKARIREVLQAWRDTLTPTAGRQPRKAWMAHAVFIP